VAGQRPDLVIINQILVVHDWYRQNLRDAYPGFWVPEKEDRGWDTAIMEANDRPICYVDEVGALFCNP
jgi:hypothetical protein